MALIAVGAFMDASSNNLTRPSSFYFSQAIIGFASLLFLAQAMVIGIRAHAAHGRQAVHQLRSAVLAQPECGGLIGGAALGSFQTVREKAHSHELVQSIVATDPQVVARLQGSAAIYSRTVSDPSLRAAAGAGTLSQQVSREANILAFNDVFMLVGVLASLTVLWGLWIRWSIRRRGEISPVVLLQKRMQAARRRGGTDQCARCFEWAQCFDPERALRMNETTSPPPASEPKAPPAPGPASPAPVPTGWRPPPRSKPVIIGIASVALIGVLAILYAWRLPPFAGVREETDNAYVRGRVAVISPQVSGYVTQVTVQDFAEVKAGQILATIDDRIYKARVAQAQANVAAQEAALANSTQALRSRETATLSQDAAIATARASLERAQLDCVAPTHSSPTDRCSAREHDQTRATPARERSGPSPVRSRPRNRYAGRAHRLGRPFGSRSCRRRGESASYGWRRSTSRTR